MCVCWGGGECPYHLEDNKKSITLVLAHTVTSRDQPGFSVNCRWRVCCHFISYVDTKGYQVQCPHSEEEDSIATICGFEEELQDSLKGNISAKGNLVCTKLGQK